MLVSATAHTAPSETLYSPTQSAMMPSAAQADAAPIARTRLGRCCCRDVPGTDTSVGGEERVGYPGVPDRLFATESRVGTDGASADRPGIPF